MGCKIIKKQECEAIRFESQKRFEEQVPTSLWLVFSGFSRAEFIELHIEVFGPFHSTFPIGFASYLNITIP